MCSKRIKICLNPTKCAKTNGEEETPLEPFIRAAADIAALLRLLLLPILKAAVVQNRVAVSFLAFCLPAAAFPKIAVPMKAEVENGPEIAIVLTHRKEVPR
jgi:hypothetical protein